MAFTIVTHPQRSPEWFQSRLGRITGSRASDILATIKTGEAAARRDYRMEIVCERLTGRRQEEGFVSDAMKRGTELEPVAFAVYEAVTGQLVRSTGFLSHSTIMAGCSLDGDVNDFAGIVELKCPKTATHLRYLRGDLPKEHHAQITHNLWISGAPWCDFVSFDDRLPEELQFFRLRIDRHEPTIAAYEQEALKFLREVDAEIEAIRALGSVTA
jgi:YqaJ-like viral recombinase domain